jgi:hypothetical protein
MLGLALAAGGASAVSAHVKDAPTVNFFASPLPTVGTTLSNSTNTPSIHLKDGWRMSSPNGIASAYVDFRSGGSTSQIWSYSGGADSVAGRYQWSQQIGTYSDLEGSATDKLGNTGTNYAYISPTLSDSGAASYSSGWKTSTCKCYTNDQILYSTKAGATATYHVSYSRLVSFVSDMGPSQGVVALKVNGQTVKDVKLTAASKVNRVIVWNSGYLNANDSYNLTVKVISGRVDVEGFITN